MGITLFVVAATLVGFIALAVRGVDFIDYVLLSRPPYIVSTAVAAWVVFLVVGQTLGPVLVMFLFRPSRVMACNGFCRPADGPGAILRLLGGVGLALALQVGWSAVGPAPAEHWRTVEHLVYAVVGGGEVWPVVLLVLAVGLVGPVAEEVIFRGMVFGVLRRRWGFLASALVSAVIFGLPHGPVTALPTAILGFYLAWQTEQDRSLVGAITLHVLNNLGALVAISATL